MRRLWLVLLALMQRLQPRPPDFVIGIPGDPYMLRWYILPRNPYFNVYLHKVLRSDDDRALHNHPWVSLSLSLSGSCTEITRQSQRLLRAGCLTFRGADYAHRLILRGNRPYWTLFITGPRIREWGFFCPQGFVPWQEFTEPTNYGNIGKGCGED